MLDIETQASLMLTSRASKAKQEAERREQEYPLYRQLQNAIAEQACREVMAIIKRTDDANEAVAQAKAHVKELTEKFEKLLKVNALPPDYFEPPYHCKKCNDTGRIDGRRCGCLEHLITELTCIEMNASTPLRLSTFSSFDVTYYSDERPDPHRISPREVMDRTLTACIEYARNFEPHSKWLIFQGGTGLGKTHLALAIAGEVMRQGHNVIYDTMQNIFTTLEDVKFGRNSRRSLEDYKRCDLLIIDDLGSEFHKKNHAALLFEIIDSRVMGRKPIIFTTNLTMQGITELYDERTASRIAGECRRLEFEGSDVRIEKRKRRING